MPSNDYATNVYIIGNGWLGAAARARAAATPPLPDKQYGMVAAALRNLGAACHDAGLGAAAATRTIRMHSAGTRSPGGHGLHA